MSPPDTAKREWAPQPAALQASDVTPSGVAIAQASEKPRAKVRGFLFSHRLSGTRPNRSIETGKTVAYFHGGAPGLTLGDSILPRNDQAAWLGKGVVWREGKAAESFGDMGETVSLTTDIAIAEAYAGEYVSPNGLRESGQVYQVQPLTKAATDPDYPASFPTIARCEKGALIVAVRGIVPVESNPRVLTKAIGAHFVYRSDHSPLYDNAGYLHYTPAWATFGASQSDLRALGPWMPMHLIPSDRFHIPHSLPPRITDNQPSWAALKNRLTCNRPERKRSR